MTYKCQFYGCGKEFGTVLGTRTHEGRWCKYKADSSRNLFNKRKAEIEAEIEAKRARLEIEREIRARPARVSLAHIPTYICTYLTSGRPGCPPSPRAGWKTSAICNRIHWARAHRYALLIFKLLILTCICFVERYADGPEPGAYAGQSFRQAYPSPPAL